MTPPIRTHGTQLKLGDALVSPTYATVANIETITVDGFARATTDVFTHDNATGIAERVVDELATAGQVTCQVAWDPAAATHDETTGLLSVALSGDERPWQLVFPDTGATQLEFNGVISNFSWPSLDAQNGVLRMNITLSMTSGVTVT